MYISEFVCGVIVGVVGTITVAIIGTYFLVKHSEVSR